MGNRRRLPVFHTLWMTKAGNRILGFGFLGAAAVFCGLAAWLRWDLRHLFPPCIFLKITGLRCPGCGGTRMVAFLVKGDIPTALYYNPLLLLMAVVLVALLLWMLLRTFQKNWQPIDLHIRSRLWILLPAVVAVFWVIRNTGWYREVFF